MIVENSKKSNSRKKEDINHITSLPSVEGKLLSICRQNEWALALLSISIAKIRYKHKDKDTAEGERDKYLREGMKHLEESIFKENSLLKSVDQVGVTVTGKHFLPSPPCIVSRSSSSITLKLKLEDTNACPSSITMMVFGKSEGAGTDVSLNNVDYPGLGVPIVVEKGKEAGT